MKLNAYSVFDNKALAYNVPFFVSTDGAAVRMFADLANDAQSAISRHPGDYILYRVGSYDDQTGGITAEDPKAHVADAISLVKLEPTPLFDNVQQRRA